MSEDSDPARYFSVDRGFRDEAGDVTEFYYIEGLIADFGLSLGGIMKFREDLLRQLGTRYLNGLSIPV